MFDAIARTAFDAFARRGATQPATWTPSNGEPACAGNVVRQRIEGETAFSGETVRHDVVEFIKADFPGIAPGECLEISGAEWVVRSIVVDDGVLMRVAIGQPDHARPAA